jgi:paraquat-inducible protein B
MLLASFVTGQRYIELDFTPDEPARLAGLGPRYPELPTTPTALEKLGEQAEAFLEKVAELPMDEMLEDVRRVIRATRETIDSEELRGAFRAADRALTHLEPALADARRALGQSEELIETLRAEASTTGARTRETFTRLRETLERAETSLGALDDTLGAADDARVEASRTLAELRQTLGVMRNLAEYIQTHPEAVVLGKPDAKEDK